MEQLETVRSGREGSKAVSAGSRIAEGVMETIAECLSRLAYGYVKIVVQDGKVVQVETTEKLRF